MDLSLVLWCTFLIIISLGICFRLIRKMDVMLVNSLAGMGEEACELAFAELVTYRRQGLFIVAAQFSCWDEEHTKLSSDSQSPSESFG